MPDHFDLGQSWSKIKFAYEKNHSYMGPTANLAVCRRVFGATVKHSENRRRCSMTDEPPAKSMRGGVQYLALPLQAPSSPKTKAHNSYLNHTAESTPTDQCVAILCKVNFVRYTLLTVWCLLVSSVCLE